MANAESVPRWAARSPLVIHAPTMDDPWRWLGRGWEDLWRNPLLSLGYGAAFVGIGLLVTAGLWALGLESMAPALAAGFTLLGPVLAVGLYEMSRRYEARESVSLRAVVAPRVPSPPQFAFLAFVLMFLFLIWLRLATLNYALFTHGSYVPVRDFLDFALKTEEGLTMLVVGTLAGGALAAIAYAISAISVPLLLRHDIDVLTAIWISVQTVLNHPGPMLLWAWLIAVLTAIGLATMFLGLIVVFPLIGHATWHAYRTIVIGESSPP
ncbi:MAG: DUF2189 domain-containing protein [Alphaproteobacteria bacterium]|nr:DUF2189 domain-containing protein [Alphaproteobacteria bacterium]